MKRFKKFSLFLLVAALVSIGCFASYQVAQAGTLTSTNVQPASLLAGATSQVTVSFSTIGVIPPGGKVKVTFGAGFNVAGANGGICPTFPGDGGITGFITSVADQVVTIARVAGTATTATNAETCTIEGIINPAAAGSTGTYTITTTNPSNVLIDNDVAVTADIITSPAPTLAQPTVVPASPVKALSTGKIIGAFSVTNPGGSSDTIDQFRIENKSLLTAVAADMASVAIYSDSLTLGIVDGGDTLACAEATTNTTTDFDAGGSLINFTCSSPISIGAGATQNYLAVITTTVGATNGRTIAARVNAHLFAANAWAAADLETTNPITIDTVAPTVTSVVWTPVGGHTVISAGDAVVVTFSEKMDTSTLTTGNPVTLATELGLSAGIFGTTGFSAVWNGSTNTILTITLGTETTILSGATIDPTAAVKDVAGNYDNTTPAVAILDNVAPIISPAFVVNNQVQPNTVTVTASEPINSSDAQDSTNWTITNNDGSVSRTIASAVLSGGNIVTLTLAAVNPSTHGTFITNADADAHIKVTMGAGIHDLAAGTPNASAGAIVTGAGETLTKDVTAPTVTLTYSKDGGVSYATTKSVKAGDTLKIKATFNEAIADSPVMKVAVDNSILSATNMTKVSAPVYTYDLTVPVGNIATAAVSLSVGTDVAGNLVSVAAPTNPSFAIDNTAPTIVIGSDKAALRKGQAAAITFTLLESSANFAFGDVVFAGGILSAFAGAGTSYTATFTPTDESTTLATIDVATPTFTDAAGNANVAAAQLSMTVDTVAPTLVSAVFTDNALKIGETSLVTFTFLESITGFTNSDLTIANGGLTAVTVDGIDPTVYTATFTPTADIEEATNVITVAMTGVADTAGNAGIGTTPSSNYAIDTLAPSTPTASPVADTYTSVQSVMFSSTGSTSIRYTTDGTDPSTCSSGSLFSGAISVSSSQTIKARGCDAAGNISTLSSFTYTISISSGGGGGGNVTPACTDIVYGDYSTACFGGYQYRSAVSRTPSNCALTAAQQEASKRVCSTPANINVEVNSNEPPATPPTIALMTCNICQKLTYDVYIINPDGSERHTGTPWVRVTDRGNGIKRYSFEDKTLNPQDPNYDYNDFVIDVDLKNCQSVKFMFVSSDAAWKHQVRFKVLVNGLKQSDILIADDSKAVVGTFKTVNAAGGVDIRSICSTESAAFASSLKGKILLQVQAHGEAWYVNPLDGQRYYLANGDKAYDVMRNFGIGITNKNLEKIKSSKTFAKSNSGKIFLQVESRGEAYYIDFNGVAHYLKDGAAAYEIMGSLGLGITNNDLNKIVEGSL